MIDLTGKVALVTGGSRGIGEGIVRGLRAEGADVVFNYATSRDRAEALADEMGRDHCLAIQCELGPWQAAEALWREAEAWKGGLDVLVNNAATRKPVAMAADAAEWDAVWVEAFRVNLLATAHLSRLAIAHYKTRGGGIIIGITMRPAVRGDRPEFFHDGASAGGMNSLMRGIARFYGADNVTTFLVVPGIIESDQADDFVKHYGAATGLDEIPLGAFGKPEDIANIVTFLASGKARYASGSTIDVVGASFLH